MSERYTGDRYTNDPEDDLVFEVQIPYQWHLHIDSEGKRHLRLGIPCQKEDQERVYQDLLGILCRFLQVVEDPMLMILVAVEGYVL
jgi:hypothetical protein